MKWLPVGDPQAFFADRSRRTKVLRLSSLIKTCFNKSPRIAPLGLDATSGENCLHHLSASHLAAAFQVWLGRTVSLGSLLWNAYEQT